VLFTILLGLIYPLAITGLASVAFPYQAGGSLVRDAQGQVIGSALLGQGFAKDQFLHPRPSAAGSGYDASASAGSNYGPLSPDLAKRVASDAASLRTSTGHQEIPDDAITASASGLDPDISPAYALLQVDRIAKARGVTSERVRDVIESHIQAPALGFLGQPHVNVLITNLALDKAFPSPKAPPG
jgi:K+-transporting ATPase ATPase C chain